MNNPPTTISQAQLVNGPHPGEKLPQYIAALSGTDRADAIGDTAKQLLQGGTLTGATATLGALATGTLLGWSSPAGPKLKDGEYGFPISDSDNAWIGSMLTLGAAVTCFPIGALIEMIGRKVTMMLLVIPFTLGWILIIFATNVPMMMVGRFITGIAAGGFCVAAPAYNSEIAQDETRGMLGTFFQLMLTIGILFAYAVGGYTSVFLFSIICAIIPLVFLAIFYFMPETPYYLVKQNKTKEATKSLKWLRGSDFDLETELQLIEASVKANRENPTTFRENFSKKSSIKALVICICLMVFQQFSGINAVLFNTTRIFNDSDTDTEAAISPAVSTIIIGVIQVVATFLSTIAIEKLGRRFLLLTSCIVMMTGEIVLGVYFNLKNAENPDQEMIDSISWLRLVSLCIVIVAFSIGMGPIPWMVAGDMCASNIKAFVTASAGTCNWVLAFVITRTFVDMQTSFGEDGTFWFYAAFIALGAVFIYFVVPETKGKSINEIQKMLSGDSPKTKS